MSRRIGQSRREKLKNDEQGFMDAEATENALTVFTPDDELNAPDVLVYTPINRVEDRLMLCQNIFVIFAATLFLAGQFIKALEEYHTLTNGIAYILGAGAYIMEVLILTDCLKRKHHPRELFMPYIFGVLYVILGISYFVKAFG